MRALKSQWTHKKLYQYILFFLGKRVSFARAHTDWLCLVDQPQMFHYESHGSRINYYDFFWYSFACPLTSFSRKFVFGPKKKGICSWLKKEGKIKRKKNHTESRCSAFWQKKVNVSLVRSFTQNCDHFSSGSNDAASRKQYKRSHSRG